MNSVLGEASFMGEGRLPAHCEVWGISGVSRSYYVGGSSDAAFRSQYCAARITKLTTRVGSRVVSVLDSGAEGLGFKSKPRRCRVTVLGKLFTPIVPLFTKQRNW